MKDIRTLQNNVYNADLMSRISHPYSPLPTPYSLLFFFLPLIFLSCQTAPKIPDFSLDQHLPLEPDGYVYLLAGKDAMPLLNQLGFTNVNNVQFQLMVDQTQFIMAAVYMTPNSHYRLAAWGNYPAARAKMALGTNKEWKKHRSTVSGANYWHSSQNGFSVAITGKMALVAASPANTAFTSIDPYSVPPGTAIPEGFAAFREGSILSCWLNNPGPVINQKIGEMGIPLNLPAEQLFVSLYPAENQRYVAHLQIQVPSETQARGLTVAFAIARSLLPPQADKNNPAFLLPSILFANPPALDGKNINITTAPLTTQEIALLLKMFAIE